MARRLLPAEARLAGLAVPLLGTLAAGGLVLYFIGEPEPSVVAAALAGGDDDRAILVDSLDVEFVEGELAAGARVDGHGFSGHGGVTIRRL